MAAVGNVLAVTREEIAVESTAKPQAFYAMFRCQTQEVVGRAGPIVQNLNELNLQHCSCLKWTVLCYEKTCGVEVGSLAVNWSEVQRLKLSGRRNLWRLEYLDVLDE